MTPRELKTVEKLVNQKIWEAIEVKTTITDPETGKKMGALALFNGKYGDHVRVVQMGDFSTEFCGGTHCSNTSQIGIFKIMSESAVGAGMRRIEAVTSRKAYQFLANRSALLDELQADVKATKPEEIKTKLDSLEADLHDSHKEIAALKAQINKAKAGSIFDKAEQAGKLTVIAEQVSAESMNDLRELADNWKNGQHSNVLALAADINGKANMVIALDQTALDQGLKAGNLIKEVASDFGGGGGGRPNMAQAGGKNPAGLPKALQAIKDLVARS
jgi:alanyl-tRNA synthetase